MPLLATFDKAGTVTHLFDRVIDGQPPEFLSVDEFLTADDKTDSHWEKISGRCVSGSLKGTLLKQRVGIVSFRKAWDNFHPDSRDVTF